MKHHSSAHHFYPSLKVCGLTKRDQIQELIAMNADFLGFIFYEKSPRYVLNHLTLEEISLIDYPGKVGVFVNEEVDKIFEITQKAGLNFIQLHGDESDDFMIELKKKLHPETGIIKVIRIGDNTAENKNKIKQIINILTPELPVAYYLFDTDSKAFGGTGKQFDWSILNELNIPLPYFLSGGISEENIGHIETLNHKPFALDINSKFETSPGNKDIERIKKFSQTIQKSPNGTI
ncbi:phosphoribosylanthranilate isomerase [Chryseobacterium indologenes]|uniref:phosphoribosylanthranilate isomerase n=1 Tax=Chryseobacterium indologenes TaxID=253 RepID=UPI0003E06501|nr:phosphoribosylanthranilate isomerase [Chryseobacterium indologenes]QPQ50732.1 phosphoribosylanthranilate isomerase [Chryseobacterium indologenes]GAE62833.1 N-(5'-phosphoribosyl)anthranilate isomerase [Chryseobacterium indologenes NBRC 14944]SFJ21982.1 phosphoribosylanthranilate isomerase [Chryseobacterium indologenes]SUX53441.1 N-(5'-phosphoribosyl)anthranilate isomerase [Chryseobacterium indologenes]